MLRRISEGCRKATTLHREVTAQGFTGSYGIVRAFVELHRTRPNLSVVTKPPSVREVTGWICRHPDHLVEQDTGRLRAVLDRCPELAAAVELVRSFADMLTDLRGDQLSAWITAAEQAALAGTTGFATGLTGDLDAVTAGLTLPYSSGPVEGNVNRIKMLKGRCTVGPISICFASVWCSLPDGRLNARPTRGHTTADITFLRRISRTAITANATTAAATAAT